MSTGTGPWEARSGLRIFAFANQHRIAKGEAAIEEFEEQFRTYGFDQAYICPHSSEAGCACRKPGIGMLLRAAGWGEGSLTEFKHRWPDIEPDYIAADIWEAAKYLIHR
ncbi:hypothetical protein [Paenibacillus dendritiformis]|uniref:hypothetical protein n=1 Tax=Paenibacillus dendritiformis TaxID=130049 RepID=UPI00387E04B6